MRLFGRYILTAFMCAAPSYVWGGMHTSGQNDYDDVSIREDSVVIEGWEFEDFEVKIPRFIRLKDNAIRFNGADWTNLREKLAGHDSVPFSILHIGDSHLQADISTGYVRQQMQFDYGDAGRGLVVPLKLSRTNEPVDYYFKSDNSWSPLKFMSATWPRTMGFTGASLMPASSHVSVNIGSRVTDTYSTFNEITIYHQGNIEVIGVKLDNGNVLNNPIAEYGDGVTRVQLPFSTGNVTLDLKVGPAFSLFGAFLSGNRPGLIYSVIGNNGATYNSYNRIPQMGRWVSRLHPDLVIISLGTNDVFSGSVNEARIIDSIDKLVNDIKRYNPKSEILLTTPMECQRNGTPNHNMKAFRDVVLQYGKDHHIAVYDWYAVSGGDGASVKWIGEALYGRDRIHHTVKGYRVAGFMLYDALTKALNQ